MDFQKTSLFRKPTPFQQFLWSPLKYSTQHLYRLFSSFCLPPAPSAPPIRVVCVSDTHNRTPDIPDGDLLVHAGDLTKNGTPQELAAQITWLASLPHTHKIVIAGNHDTFLDPAARPSLAPADRIGEPDWQGLTYLQASSALLDFPEHERQLKVYGAPYVPLCGGSSFAFQYARHLHSWTAEIPGDVDVLVTHTPPRFQRDVSAGSVAASGCEALLARIWRVRPLLHVYGHIHASHGRSVLGWDRGQAAYERMCRRQMAGMSELISWRAWREFWAVLVFGLMTVVLDRVWGPSSASRASVLVNAAMSYDENGCAENEVQVVLL